MRTYPKPVIQILYKGKVESFSECVVLREYNKYTDVTCFFIAVPLLKPKYIDQVLRDVKTKYGKTNYGKVIPIISVKYFKSGFDLIQLTEN